MKEKTALVLCLLSFSLGTLALIAPARAESWAWVEPSYKGFDPYYPSHGQYITGYLTGTNWNFSMSWYNPYYYLPYSPYTMVNALNISAVRIYFDWGQNYTYRLPTPLAIKPGATHTFSIYNMTPPTTEAPELWLHSYQVYIHHVSSTLKEQPVIIGPLGSDFAVLSENHLACLNLLSKYGTLIPTGGATSTAQTITSMYFPNITAVQINYTKALLEFQQGWVNYQTGAFGAARSHLQQGETYYNSAVATWLDKGTAIENANLDHIKSETNYNNALSNSSMVNAYGWLLFGLGWTFIGIGIIIYGSRKPKTVQS